jgi:hypothetical protein
MVVDIVARFPDFGNVKKIKEYQYVCNYLLTGINVVPIL